jgi:hypothetical protein
MKILRILAGVGGGLFVIWGLIALFHTLARRPGERPFFFWLALPYPVLIALTVAIIAVCARNSRPSEAVFSWFTVVVAATASIGLTLVVSTGLFSIISWAYFGRVAFTSTAPTDANYVAIYIAFSAACYIWAGAIAATLSSSRPLSHALATGVLLLLGSCAMALLLRPFGIAQLLVALTLPIPLAAWGARLQQARMAGVHGQQVVVAPEAGER